MRTKPIAIIAALLVGSVSLSACHGDRPGHWGPRHHHHHDRDYRDDGYRR